MHAPKSPITRSLSITAHSICAAARSISAAARSISAAARSISAAAPALVVAAALIVLSPAAAAAGTAGKATHASGPGIKVVRSANDAVSALLRKKAAAGSTKEKKLAARITAELRSFLDVDELGQRALVDHWKGLTPAQRTQFSSLLRQLIERNYVQGMRANLKYKVNYIGETEKGALLLVSTEVVTKRHGRPYKIAIDYLLRNDKGHWRAFDVVTDGIGLVENYRAQFNKLIAKRGFDDLLARMKKKADAMSK